MSPQFAAIAMSVSRLRELSAVTPIRLGILPTIWMWLSVDVLDGDVGVSAQLGAVESFGG